jgi:hypothetical protein
MKNTTIESLVDIGKTMDVLKEYQNPSKLLVALMDSIDEPVCLVDDIGNCILNQTAQELKNIGFDVDKLSVKLKNNTSSTFSHKGKKYKISKKDINHGTNSFVCVIKAEDDTIARLTESSKKLKKVLSAL